jgi:peptide/nickel transport system substrate-binding protein
MWDPAASIIPNGRSDEELATTPIGTGPFILGENIPDESVTYVRNEAYWNAPLPYLDTMQYRIIPDPTSQVAALASGACGYSLSSKPNQHPHFASQSQYRHSAI